MPPCGLSRRDAAACAGITPEYLAKIERGQRNLSLRSLERIADAIGVESHLGLDNGDLFREPEDFAALLATAVLRRST